MSARRLTLFRCSHVLLQLEFLLAQLQYTVLYAVLGNQLNHLYGSVTAKNKNKM